MDNKSSNQNHNNETAEQAVTISASGNKGGPVHSAKISTTRKRPMGNNHGPRSKKPREPDFNKSELPNSLSLSPRKQYYSIYTGNTDLPRIADASYAVMRARVKSLVDVISLEQFRYIVAISWFARLVDINIGLSTGFAAGSSLLKQAVRGICLPPSVCKYIETLGVYKLHNGAKVVPYVSNYRDLVPMLSPWYYDPLEAIDEARRPHPDNDWSIDFDWITDYTLNTVPKLMRSGIELRPILPGLEGRAELVMGYMPKEGNLIQPLSPEVQTLSTALLGAAYRFRDYTERNEWPHGENEILTPLFEGEVISPELTIASAMQESLRTMV